MWMWSLIIVNTILMAGIWISRDKNFQYWKLPLYLLLTLGFTCPLCCCAATTVASLHVTWWFGIPILLFYSGMYYLFIKGARIFFPKTPAFAFSLQIEFVLYIASVLIFPPAID